jgi:GNAT superfamily N-acetyltransferase
MTADDLPAVCAIAATIHPTLPERPAVFSEKRGLFPQGCFVLEGEEGLNGYAFAHPWRLRSIPPLDGFLTQIPAAADCLYLHDAAVLPAARGKAAAPNLIALLRATATDAGLQRLALVSVYGTSALWSRLGFAAVADAALASALASYGPEAAYMAAPTA